MEQFHSICKYKKKYRTHTHLRTKKKRQMYIFNIWRHYKKDFRWKTLQYQAWKRIR